MRLIPLLPFLLSLSLLTSPVSPARETGPDPLTDLLDTERAFASDCSENGVAASFARFAADGAVVFSPEPSDLAGWLEKHPAPDSLLEWRPLAAGVARSGDLGWTSGPWSMASEGESGGLGGTYLTVWRRQTDGRWKWEADIGIPHPRQEEPDEVVVTAPGGGTSEAGARLEATRTRLFMIDRLLGVATEMQDRARSYASYGDPDLRLYRLGRPPIVGLEAAIEVLGEVEVTENWKTLGGGISNGADLGYTYGAVQTVSGPRGSRAVSGYYLRIWRRDDDGIWRLLADVELPAPEA